MKPILPPGSSLDYTASVFLVKQNKILLHYHKKLNMYLQPGGHIEKGELPSEAAVREVREETGIHIDLKPQKVGETYNIPSPTRINTHRIHEGHWHCDFTYTKKVPTKTSSTQGEWLTAKQIESHEQIPCNVKEIALEILKNQSE